MSLAFDALGGWIGAVLSLALFAAAFGRSSTPAACAGAVVSIPFCAEASGYPIFGWIGWLALVGNVAAAGLLRVRKDIALTALTPFLGICLFLLILSIRGIRLWHP